MTRIKIVVRHTRTSFGWAWTAVLHDDGDYPLKYHAGYSTTWADGLELAHAAARQLHDDEMDAVYESRARRREKVLA